MSTDTSNLGKWEPWYKDIPNGSPPRPYGNSPTYEMGAKWLEDCWLVEDWGCGMGWFRLFLKPNQGYIGLDGTLSPFVDYVVDLAKYTAKRNVPGIFMRGVLEHDYNWRTILTNAVESFTHRMCLVLFTPMDRFPEQLAYNEEIGVPDLSLRMSDVVSIIDWGGIRWKWEDVQSDTGYGQERVFYLEK